MADGWKKWDSVAMGPTEPIDGEVIGVGDEPGEPVRGRCLCCHTCHTCLSCTCKKCARNP